jgi:cell division protease FtsH
VPPRRTWLTFLLILLINVAIARLFFPSQAAPVKVPYTLFREQVTARNVQAIYSRGTSITGRFNKAVTYPRDTTGGGRPSPLLDFATELPSFVDPPETQLINNGGDQREAGPGTTSGRATPSFAPTLLIIALYGVSSFALRSRRRSEECSAADSGRALRAGTIRQRRTRSPSTTSLASTKRRTARRSRRLSRSGSTRGRRRRARGVLLSAPGTGKTLARRRRRGGVPSSR